MGEAPPLTGVAVKTTVAPAHTALLGVLIVTAGVTAGVTLMVTVFDVAVAGEAQVALLVITQENTSLAARPVATYVADVAPLMLLPFFFH